MNKINKTYLFLMMAGKGTRFGASVPKQFVKINKEPIFIYLLKQLDKIDEIDEIVIVTNPDYYNETIDYLSEFGIQKIAKVLPGGKGRTRDIGNAINTINNANDDDVILFYDATHPIVDKEGLVKVIDAIKESGAATLAEFQYDTVYQIDSKIKEITNLLERREVVAGASPEGIKYGIIKNIYDNSTDEELDKLTSMGAMAITNGIKMKVIETNVVNLKITYPADYNNFIKIANSENKSKIIGK